MSRIIVYDSDSSHANNIISGINIGYGSNITSDCLISDRGVVNTATSDNNVVAIIRSHTGWSGFETTAKNLYNDTTQRVQTFFAAGSNTFELVNNITDSANLPFIVLTGAGDVGFEDKNNTGYAVEFWDNDLVQDNNSDQSSYSNGVILGKILKIKDTLNCSWWEARYRARITATRTESNRVIDPYDLYNGFGNISIANAIAYSGSTPADPYLIEEPETETTMTVIYSLRNPIDKTLTEMRALITAGTVIPGQKYRITTGSSIGVMIVTGLTSNTLEQIAIREDTKDKYVYTIGTTGVDSGVLTTNPTGVNTGDETLTSLKTKTSITGDFVGTNNTQALDNKTLLWNSEDPPLLQSDTYFINIAKTTNKTYQIEEGNPTVETQRITTDKNPQTIYNKIISGLDNALTNLKVENINFNTADDVADLTNNDYIIVNQNGTSKKATIEQISGSIYASEYFILKSPNGNKWKISIDDSGNLNTSLL